MTEALLDANALIAAFFPQHVDNARSRPFVEGLDHFYTTPATQGALLRYLTRPWKDEQREPQPPLMKPATALTLLEEIEKCPAHVFLPDDVSFASVSLTSLSGHKQWTDAYLIALARRHKLKLATLERKMDNMDDLRSPVLLRIK
jgi:predicted nucleic acid-binding protein